MSFSTASLIGNILFSGIGFVAFTYGKRMGNARMMIQGGALMAYAYFVPTTFWVYAVGVGLTAWTVLTRDA